MRPPHGVLTMRQALPPQEEPSDSAKLFGAGGPVSSQIQPCSQARCAAACRVGTPSLAMAAER